MLVPFKNLMNVSVQTHFIQVHLKLILAYFLQKVKLKNKFGLWFNYTMVEYILSSTLTKKDEFKCKDRTAHIERTVFFHGYNVRTCL